MNIPITSNQRSDINARATERGAADLEHGARRWLKTLGDPGSPVPARTTALPYRQTLELGAHVRQGEHGTTVVYADRIGKTPTTPATTSSARPVPAYPETRSSRGWSMTKPALS
jgi:antirestriction protein ArdC